MKNRVSTLILLLSILCCAISLAQNTHETDSLSQLISSSKNDSVKVKALNKLAFAYAFNDAQKSLALLKQSEKISIRKNLKFGHAEMLMNRGILHDITGNPDSARYFFQKSQQLAKKYQFKNLEVRNINNLGMVFWNTGKFDDALRCFFEALKINQSLPTKDQVKFDTLYNNIGLIYQQMNLDEKALVYHRKAYEIRKEKQMLREQAISLNNIGICYNSLGKTKLAVTTYMKGIQIAKQSGDEVDLLKILENLGNSYQSLHKYDDAISCYLQVAKSPNASPKMQIGALTGLTAAYNIKGKPKKGLENAEKGILLLKQHPDLRLFASHLYQYAAQSHYMLREIAQGENDNREFLAITKELFSKETSEKIADYEIKYETAEKEKMLAENKANLMQSKNDSRQKSVLLIGFSILTLFIIIIGILVYRQQKLKNNQLEQEHKLKTAIVQIEMQNKLQEQRLNISRDLHDNIGAQLTFIISSVENLKFAFNLTDTKIDDKLNNISNFAKATILELRDTIWAMNHEAILFEDLRARILNFIEKANDASEMISFKFTIGDELSGTTLSSLAGMNIYRTIQEAVNNALKYSQADEVKISVTCIERRISILIVDNGIGFDIAQIEKGNGLQNMQKRIEDIDGIFDLVSHENSGTKISITLPQSCVV